MIEQVRTNPLTKHFRQPALYIKPTSRGKYWKEGSLELPVTGEMPVFPMTAKDEITIRTPDALISGTSVVEVFQSCCPAIKNAWEMPSVDVDSTLIAIRIASYGPTMTISAKCGNCNEEHDYDVDLGVILEQIQMPDYSAPVTTEDGLKIYLRPLTYYQVNQSGNIEFEEEKLIQNLTDPSIPEDVQKVQYDAHIKKMIDLNLKNVSNATSYIEADGSQITDPEFIEEYYKNSDGAVLRKVQKQIKEYSDIMSIKPLLVNCTSCEKSFNLQVTFDYASFFDRGS